MKFNPKLQHLATVQPTRPVSELVDEVSVYAASPAFVRRHCGPIANQILDSVPADYFDRCSALGMLPNVDVRVHRLNVGEYPAVPGWHCDGVMRETYHGQPDVDRIRVRDTVLCTVSSGAVCNPEVILQQWQLDTNGLDGLPLWKHVHAHVPAELERTTLEDGVVALIGESTLHRVMPARVRGARVLFRMSMWHNDYLGDQGRIANQQQVYLLNEGNGW